MHLAGDRRVPGTAGELRGPPARSATMEGTPPTRIVKYNDAAYDLNPSNWMSHLLYTYRVEVLGNPTIKVACPEAGRAAYETLLSAGSLAKQMTTDRVAHVLSEFRDVTRRIIQDLPAVLSELDLSRIHQVALAMYRLDLLDVELSGKVVEAFLRRVNDYGERPENGQLLTIARRIGKERIESPGFFELADDRLFHTIKAAQDRSRALTTAELELVEGVLWAASRTSGDLSRAVFVMQPNPSRLFTLGSEKELVIILSSYWSLFKESKCEPGDLRWVGRSQIASAICNILSRNLSNKHGIRLRTEGDPRSPSNCIPQLLELFSQIDVNLAKRWYQHYQRPIGDFVTAAGERLRRSGYSNVSRMQPWEWDFRVVERAAMVAGIKELNDLLRLYTTGQEPRSKSAPGRVS